MAAEERPSGTRTLIVFAREPLPGQVKTRLTPALGPAGAARLYQSLLVLALQVAAAVPGVRRELWCAGAPTGGGLCSALAYRYGLTPRRQPEGDLGQRMAAALDSSLAGTDRAVLIGSDCPEYDPAYLGAAFAALEVHDAVLGPAADGGYCLIGLRRRAPDLFRDIPWGSDAVLARTRAALEVLGWTWTELPTLRDLDRPADLAAFSRLLDPDTPLHRD